jgi:hypothetical protein
MIYTVVISYSGTISVLGTYDNITAARKAMEADFRKTCDLSEAELEERRWKDINDAAEYDEGLFPDSAWAACVGCEQTECTWAVLTIDPDTAESHYYEKKEN